MDFQVLELDSEGDGSAIQDYLGQKTGATSVPRVFVNGKFIGGGTETKELHQQGKLLALVNGS